MALLKSSRQHVGLSPALADALRVGDGDRVRLVALKRRVQS